ncbi:Sleepless protein [Popillia japonica]|uniref:Sleepless protein n=1 Tax=Popillia japonica TaxID=7064 RepID=A0AAW1KHA0_POPJA
MNSIWIYLLIFAVLETAEALRCWKCQSTNDKNCGDPFLKIPTNSRVTNFTTEIAAIVTCKQPILPFNHPKESIRAMCMKKVAVFGERKYYSRSCTFLPVDQIPSKKCPDHETNVPYDNVDHCDICGRDLCNGSEVQQSTACLGVLVITIYLLLFNK